MNMNINIKAIIYDINTRSHKTVFDPEKSDELEKILSFMGKIKFIGHGVQSICFQKENSNDEFQNNNNDVIKCCIKKKGSIIISKENFLEKVTIMKQHHMPILPPTDIIYENDNWMIYL